MSSEQLSPSPREQLAHQLAQTVATALREDLSSQDRALLIVSGGSTPVPFLRNGTGVELEGDRADSESSVQPPKTYFSQLSWASCAVPLGALVKRSGT